MGYADTTQNQFTTRTFEPKKECRGIDFLLYLQDYGFNVKRNLDRVGGRV